MINFYFGGQAFRWRTMFSALGLLACLSTGALSANKISGTVRNESRGQPAVGDEVILVRLDPGLHEESRVRTNEQGSFSVLARYPDKPYLVRVVHQRVDYDLRASAGAALSIEVFDAAARVQGINGSIEILRVRTNGKLLHVSDLYEVRNDSSPPLTQAGERTFEVYLPAHAKIDSVLAGGPDKMGLMISAVAVRGEPGHFTVSFPLRPGATKFAFNYDLPYDGHATFRPRLAYPLQQMAVMIPPTMKFSSRSPAFEVLQSGNGEYQVQAANHLKAGEGPGFEVSGAGALPALWDRAKPKARSQSSPRHSATDPVPGRDGDGSFARTDLRSAGASPPSQSLLGGGLIATLLAACIFLAWRAQKIRKVSTPEAVSVRAYQKQRPATLLAALQQELDRLEDDRQHGLISGEEYASTQRALEKSVKGAIARAG